jgi:hypothetical protein
MLAAERDPGAPGFPRGANEKNEKKFSLVGKEKR